METLEQIENEFDSFFKAIGYSRVKDAVGRSPDFENADYVSYMKKLCVELKVLDKDYFKEGGVINAMRMVVAVPERVDAEGLGFYTMKFPDGDRKGRPDTIEEPLRRLLKKANRQLRQTNEKLFANQGHGMVLLALNMTTVIDPFIIRNLVHSLVSREFRSISGVMICTPKVAVPIDGQPSRLFLHTHHGHAPETIHAEIDWIGSKWCEFANNGGHGDDDPLDEINPKKTGLIQFPPVVNFPGRFLTDIEKKNIALSNATKNTRKITGEYGR